VLTEQRRSNVVVQVVQRTRPPPRHSGAPNRLGRIFYASENTNYETAKNPEIMKYRHQMHNAHEYFNLEVCYNSKRSVALAYLRRVPKK